MKSGIKDYIQKPLAVKAIQFHSGNIQEIFNFLGSDIQKFNFEYNTVSQYLEIEFRYRKIKVKEYEYIVKVYDEYFFTLSSTAIETLYLEIEIK